MTDIRIGVVGGSGLYQMEGLEVLEERRIDTPFGAPSDPFVIGRLEGKKVAFLPRHGKGHRLLPTELNYRANIYGFKVLGVERLISVSAVGSLKIEYAPKDIVVPDQFFDRTRHRVDTFFGDGLVAHVSLAKPICPALIDTFTEASEAAGAKVHKNGAYVCMEGPQFSTRAESEVYRSWGMDIIGMTNLQEARLAREAEICYATLAMVTDYDCWHDSHGAVDVAQVIAVVQANAAAARGLVARLPTLMDPDRQPCPHGCDRALSHAMMTAPDKRDPQLLAKLDAVAGRVL